MIPKDSARLVNARATFLAALLFVLLGFSARGAQDSSPPAGENGLAMVGSPALPGSFDRLPYANPDAPKGGRLRLGMVGTFENLNRFNLKFLRAPLFLLGAVQESLMERSQDEAKTYYGVIAQSVEFDEAQKRLTFHLDPRAHFSDGAPLTSADVLFSFDLLKDKGLPQQRVELSLVKNAEALDAHTVRFALPDSYDAELPLRLAALPVLPKHATDVGRFAEATLTPPLGSGAYVVAEVKAGERLVLRRDPNYWAKDLPMRRGLFNFDEIDIDYYKDADTLFEAFKAGLVDFREETSASRWAAGYDFPAFTAGHVVKEAIKPGRPIGMEGFAFNLRKQAFRDVRVREALSLMLDFEWINRNYYFGLYPRTKSYFDDSPYSSSGRPASAAERALLSPFPGVVREEIMEGGWIPPVHDGSPRDRELVRRAQALLTEAGYRLSDAGLVKDGVALRFEILVRSRDEERLALHFAASLKKIGVDAQVRSQEPAQYNRRRQQFEYDMLIGQWLTVAQPGGEQRSHWSEISAEGAGSVNLAGVASPAVQALIGALVAARSEEALETAARALDRVLLSGFYFIPLYHATEIWTAHVPELRHAQNPAFPMYPFGMLLENWWFERQPR